MNTLSQLPVEEQCRLWSQAVAIVEASHGNPLWVGSEVMALVEEALRANAEADEGPAGS